MTNKPCPSRTDVQPAQVARLHADAQQVPRRRHETRLGSAQVEVETQLRGEPGAARQMVAARQQQYRASPAGSQHFASVAQILQGIQRLVFEQHGDLLRQAHAAQGLKADFSLGDAGFTPAQQDQPPLRKGFRHPARMRQALAEICVGRAIIEAFPEHQQIVPGIRAVAAARRNPGRVAQIAEVNEPAAGQARERGHDQRVADITDQVGVVSGSGRHRLECAGVALPGPSLRPVCVSSAPAKVSAHVAQHGDRQPAALVGAPTASDTPTPKRPEPPVSLAFAAPYITHFTTTCAVGAGLDALRAALRDRRSGLRRNDFGPDQRLDTWIGRIDGLEQVELPASLQGWDCRNNRLAWVGLQQDAFIDAVAAARSRYGAQRVAIVIGTSTSSIGETEDAYTQLTPDGAFPADMARPIVHTPHSLGDFLQHALALEGPCVTVATACSSSAKVFAQAARLMQAGFADAVVVGGVDTLCGSVLFGFNALGLVSTQPCRPFDAERDGLSLGEAAGFALLEKQGSGPRLLGYGESSDAHHMSSPHPEGLGARLVMQDALRRAGLTAADIDYINLHGTATPKNDEIEAGAIAALFPATTLASSTKGWTGHTLGAAGILEAAIALLTLQTGEVPGILGSSQLDTLCGPQIQLNNTQRECRYVMSNSFGFGGNNCSLLFSGA